MPKNIPYLSYKDVDPRPVLSKEDEARRKDRRALTLDKTANEIAYLE